MSFDFLAVSATQSFIGRMSYSQEAMILIKKAVVMIIISEIDYIQNTW